MGNRHKKIFSHFLDISKRGEEQQRREDRIHLKHAIEILAYCTAIAIMILFFLLRSKHTGGHLSLHPLFDEFLWLVVALLAFSLVGIALAVGYKVKMKL